MAKDKKKGKAKKGSGLSPKIYGGLSKKRMAQKSATNRCVVKAGDTVTVQFLEVPDDMKEFDQHQFRDRNRWFYVPCAGKNCPLCDDEDPDVAKVNYRFICNVWNFKTKRVEILEGPKTLAGRIQFRWERKKKSFLKRTYDVSKFDTQPVEWDCDSGDEDALPAAKVAKLKKFDLEDDITQSMARYFDSESLPSKGSKTALDDDDDDDYEDDDDEDTEYDEDDLDDMSNKEVRKIAKSMGIRTKDSDGDPISKSKLIKRIIKKQG